MLLVIAIITLVLGFALWGSGNAMNNDMDVQMESIFNDGVADPGSSRITLGIILMVIAGIILVTYIAQEIQKNKEVPDGISEGETISKQESKKVPVLCINCGNKIPNGGTFCNKCGNEIKKEKILPKVIYCTKCGKENPGDSEFCAYCGTPIWKGEV